MSHSDKRYLVAVLVAGRHGGTRTRGLAYAQQTQLKNACGGTPDQAPAGRALADELFKLGAYIWN
jgi:hypothetical protein